VVTQGSVGRLTALLCFRSVKRYFLHDQGDFIIQFMDMCEGELTKNIDDIVPTRLEPLLELALRTSAANSDPYKDDMRTELLPYDLICQMCKIHGVQANNEKGTQILDLFLKNAFLVAVKPSNLVARRVTYPIMGHVVNVIYIFQTTDFIPRNRISQGWNTSRSATKSSGLSR